MRFHEIKSEICQSKILKIVAQQCFVLNDFRQNLIKILCQYQTKYKVSGNSVHLILSYTCHEIYITNTSSSTRGVRLLACSGFIDQSNGVKVSRGFYILLPWIQVIFLVVCPCPIALRALSICFDNLLFYG